MVACYSGCVQERSPPQRTTHEGGYSKVALMFFVCLTRLLFCQCDSLVAKAHNAINKHDDAMTSACVFWDATISIESISCFLDIFLFLKPSLSLASLTVLEKQRSLRMDQSWMHTACNSANWTVSTSLHETPPNALLDVADLGILLGHFDSFPPLSVCSIPFCDRTNLNKCKRWCGFLCQFKFLCSTRATLLPFDSQELGR